MLGIGLVYSLIKEFIVMRLEALLANKKAIWLKIKDKNNPIVQPLSPPPPPFVEKTVETWYSVKLQYTVHINYLML